MLPSETDIADQILYLTQSQYTDTGPTSPSTDPVTPGAWQGSHWSANFQVTGMTRPQKSQCKWESNPGSCALKVDTLTTRPKRRIVQWGLALTTLHTELSPFNQLATVLQWVLLHQAPGMAGKRSRSAVSSGLPALLLRVFRQ